MKTRKFLSILLTLAMVISLLPTFSITASAGEPTDYWTDAGNYAPSPPEYDSATSTYTIDADTELAWIAYQCNKDDSAYNGFKDYTIVLDKDIDLSAHRWTSIGKSSSAPFSGDFDGKGHKITGLKIISESTSNTLSENGLFGYVSGSAISNIGVAVFVNTKINNQNTNTGALAGSAYKSHFTGCYSTGEISAANNDFDAYYGVGRVGGLIGSITEGTVSCCYSNVAISAIIEGNEESSYIGGLVSNVDNSTIKNCYATGNISANGYQTYAGGFAGRLYKSNISASYAVGIVSGDAEYKGGFSGYNKECTYSAAYYNSANAAGSGTGTGGEVGKIEEEMQPPRTSSNFTDFTDLLNGTQSPSPWKWIAGVNSRYPVLDGVGDGAAATYSVSGTVSAGSSTVSSLKDIDVTLYRSTDSAYSYPLITGTTDSNGSYTITGVPDGSYIAVVAASESSGQSVSAQFTVSDADVTTGADITLTSVQVDYMITNNSDGSFLVNSSGNYSTLHDALAVCTSSGPDGLLNIQLGDSMKALELTSISYETSNDLISATYAGSINIKDGATMSHDKGLNIPSGVTATLDGLTVTDSSTDPYNNTLARTVNNKGALYIKGATSITSTKKQGSGVFNDTSGTTTISCGTVTATGEYGTAVNNYGTAAISDGTVSASGENGYAIRNSGTATITGGRIESTGDGISATIENQNGLTISGNAVITGDTEVIHTDVTDAACSPSLTISGGTIEATGVETGIVKSAVYFEAANGTINITGGTIKAAYSGFGTSYGLRTDGSVSVNISGGTISSAATGGESAAIYHCSKGTLSISGTDTVVSGARHGISVIGTKADGNGAAYITGGRIESTGSGGCAIYNQKSGLVKITGGMFSSSGSHALVNNDGGTMNISGGSISSASTNAAAISAYVVTNNCSTGVTITGEETSITSACAKTIAIGTVSDRTQAISLSLYGKTVHGSADGTLIIGGSKSGSVYLINSGNSATAALSALDIPIAYKFGGWTNDSSLETVISSLHPDTFSNLSTDIYLKTVLASVTLASGSLGAAGDGEITGLTSGAKYKVTSGSDVYYVKADGTLSSNAADAAALTGTQITGLTNGTSYLVEAISIILTNGSLGTAGDGKVTGLTAGVIYTVTAGPATYSVKADGTLSINIFDAAPLAGTEITGLTNGSSYLVGAENVSLTNGSLGTAGDSKIMNLISGIKYKVTSGSKVYYVKADGTLSTNASDSAPLINTWIIGLTNGTSYYVEAASVALAYGSLGTADDRKVSGLIPGIRYRLTSDSTVYYAKADGTLSTDASDSSPLTGTEITGLTNGTSYRVDASNIALSNGSLGTAGNATVTGLNEGVKYKVTSGTNVYYVKANGTLSTNSSDLAALTGTEITGLTNGTLYKVEAVSVILANDSLGTADDCRITGLPSGAKFKVTSGSEIYYVKADGTLTANEAEGTRLAGTEITGLVNGASYNVEAISVILESGSLGISDDKRITGLSSGVKYKVTFNHVIYFVKADGTLSQNAGDVAELTGTEITGLTNGTAYLVEVYSPSVILFPGSAGTAGDKCITGIPSGQFMMIVADSSTKLTENDFELYYITADGTLTAKPSGVGNYPGGTISGLTNGKIYWIMPYQAIPWVCLASGSPGAAGDACITGLTAGTKYKLSVDSTIYYVKADGTLSSNASDAAALTGTEITGLVNGTTYKVEVYTQGGGNNGGSSNHSGSSKKETPAAPNSASVVIDGKKQTAGTSESYTENGKTVTKVKITADDLDKTLSSSSKGSSVTIPISGSDAAVGSLDGQAVQNMEKKDATIVVDTKIATYTLPASEIDIAKVSKQLGEAISLKDIDVEVSVSEPSDATVKIIENAAEKGSFSIAVPAVEFKVSCKYNNKSVEVSTFHSYVERLIAIPSGVDPKKISTGIVVDPDGSYHHVPTEITVIDGIYYAKINSLTNSVYSVIYNPVAFVDVENHWAKDAINDMGSRLVVTGIGSNKYNPASDITRAEFAAIIVRALGLEPGTGTNGFTDVSSADWYYSYTKTAASYGLILGYSNGAFGPNDKITREQAMAITNRAMQITGLETSLDEGKINALLSAFKDTSKVSSYAKNSTAICIDTGLINGTSTSTIDPKANVTRAEVAIIMQRLLKKSKLI